METLQNNAGEQMMNNSQNETKNYGPFQDPEEMTDFNKIHERELEIIAENNDVLGYNIDSHLIFWPERHEQAVKAKEFLDSGGDITALSEQFEKPEELVEKAIDEELSKDKQLDDTLAKLPSGTRFRITPHATISAFSTADAIRTNENGEKTIHIDDAVMSQVRKIKEKSGDSELVVVMNQFHFGKNGEPTSNIPENTEDYTALCETFVEQSGYSEQSGKGLVLELGNECNMCHEHGGFFDSEAFAEHASPERYADFYFETAKKLKAKYPELKLSLTGVAFCDPEFIKKTVDLIQEKKEQENIEQSLIDIISFHPYRKTVDVASPVVSGESFGDNKDQTFDDQLEALRTIAKPLGAEVTVGEISFYKKEWGESVDENEQVKNAVNGREKGYFSYIWPGETILEHENPHNS